MTASITYASLGSIVSSTSMTLLFLLILSLSNQVHGSPTSPTTMADCGSQILPLAPCVPFVQGSTPAPTEQCCSDLKQVYDQAPECLCLFLNDTALSSLPINSTIALELPALCSPQIDLSICPGVGFPATAKSPSSQVSFGTNSGSSIAASPTTITVAPRPSSILFGIPQNNIGHTLKTKGLSAVVNSAIIILSAITS